MFTKRMAQENREMRDYAIHLWGETDYNPADTPIGSHDAHYQFISPFIDYVHARMVSRFDGRIPHHRIRSQVATAQRLIYSECVRTR